MSSGIAQCYYLAAEPFYCHEPVWTSLVLEEFRSRWFWYTKYLAFTETSKSLDSVSKSHCADINSRAHKSPMLRCSLFPAVLDFGLGKLTNTKPRDFDTEITSWTQFIYFQRGMYSQKSIIRSVQFLEWLTFASSDSIAFDVKFLVFIGP